MEGGRFCGKLGAFSAVVSLTRATGGTRLFPGFLETLVLFGKALQASGVPVKGRYLKCQLLSPVSLHRVLALPSAFPPPVPAARGCPQTVPANSRCGGVVCHGILQWFGLAGTVKIPLIPPSRTFPWVVMPFWFSPFFVLLYRLCILCTYIRSSVAYCITG